MLPAAETERPGRAEAKAETRRRLLESARAEFARRGYQGATLDGIAASAGFTKGALYWHFPNKQAIFVSLIGEAIEVNLGTLDRLVAPGLGATEVRARMGEWLDRADAREALPGFGVELEIEARRDPSFRATHQGMIVKHEAALGDFLVRYFNAAELTPVMPIPALATTLITLYKGFALARDNRPDGPVNSAPVVRLLLGLPIR